MDSITAAASSTNTTENTIEQSDKMGKDEFLELFVTQLKNQDPLEPMDNKEFIAQTAQFTSLEQMKNMNSNMEKFLQMQQLSQVSGLVNKQVAVLDSETGEEITGIIEKVSMADDAPQAVIDGQKYDLANIQEILG